MPESRPSSILAIATKRTFDVQIHRPKLTFSAENKLSER
jgi:hypothetical protein